MLQRLFTTRLLSTVVSKPTQVLKTSIRMQTRSKHELIPIATELKKENGLYPLTSMKLIEQERELLVEKLNSSIADTPYEFDTLFQTINRSAANPEDSVIFNYSSQLWNLGFFVQGLSHKQVPIKSDLKKKIFKGFGSLENFQNQLIAASESLFGNGWVWVVEDAEGDLRIVTTYNSGNPLIPNRLQTFEGHTFDSAQQFQAEFSTPFTLDGNKSRGHYVPILALNLWQSGYIPDFGFNLKKYVNTYLNHVNWDQIHFRVFRNKF